MATVKNPSGRAVGAYPKDDRYLFWTGLVFRPYADVAEVNATIPVGVRHRGLKVNIAGAEYWYEAGIANGDLVAFTTGGTVTPPVKVQCRIGTAYTITGSAATVTGLTAGSTNVSCTAFEDKEVRVWRSGFILPYNYDPLNGDDYVIKALADADFDVQTGFIPGEMVIIETTT